MPVSYQGTVFFGLIILAFAISGTLSMWKKSRRLGIFLLILGGFFNIAMGESLYRAQLLSNEGQGIFVSFAGYIMLMLAVTLAALFADFIAKCILEDRR